MPKAGKSIETGSHERLPKVVGVRGWEGMAENCGFPSEIMKVVLIWIEVMLYPT